ncbi:MAG TPA: hypothetical protein VNB94_07560 [Mycobacteriales bacterium]|nr:hypothetical protein [Mycobacteriales bacterium]
MRRRLMPCIAAILLLPFVHPSNAAAPQVVDARGDATPARDVVYATFETIDLPVEGRRLQITLGLAAWPQDEDPGTYTVAFDYGQCGGGKVTYDWLGGGTLEHELGIGKTATNATFWSCHAVINAAGQTVYEYESQDITVSWLPEGLQWWVPLSHGLADGVALTRTRACTGRTSVAATDDVRQRSGIDCGVDSSPIGSDYVIGSRA